MTTVLAENYQLKWHSHGTHLHSSIATLHRSESFSDVTLATVDGRYISAHRFILSACSSYLHQLFRVMGSRGGGTNSTNLVVILPSDISYRTLSILLQYMYSGEATVSNEQLNSVLRAGEILRIKGLCHNPKERERDRPSRPSSHNSNRSTPGILTQQNQNEEGSRKRPYVDNNSSLEHSEKVQNLEKPMTGDSNSSDNCSATQQKRTYSILKSLSKTEKNNENQLKDQSKSNENSVKDNENQKENSNEKSGHIEKRRSSSSEVDSTDIEQNMQIELLVKEEPIEWDDIDDTTQGNEDEQIIHSEMNIKPETFSGEEEEEDLSAFYAPLSCDICQETFNTPSLWVRHIETHPPSEMPKRRGKNSTGGCNNEGEFKLLRCDVCHEVYEHPADWVRHIQNEHTEEQLAQSNSTTTKLRTIKCDKPISVDDKQNDNCA